MLEEVDLACFGVSQARLFFVRSLIARIDVFVGESIKQWMLP